MFFIAGDILQCPGDPLLKIILSFRAGLLAADPAGEWKAAVGMYEEFQ